MGDPKDAALKMGISPGLFSFLSLSFLFSLNVYDTSWAWMGNPKDAALIMSYALKLSKFNFNLIVDFLKLVFF